MFININCLRKIMNKHKMTKLLKQKCKIQKTQKSHVSLWPELAYEAVEITHAHGTTCYKTTSARKNQFKARA